MPLAKAGTMNIDSLLRSQSWWAPYFTQRSPAASPWEAGSPYPAWNWYSSFRCWGTTRGDSHTRRRGREYCLSLWSVIGLANLFSLVLLVRALVQGGANDSHKLLLAPLQVWLTNIIVFGLAYWELDRGGPVKRATLARDKLPPADFRFSQDEDAEAVAEVAASASDHVDWAPVLVDYLYVSLTNSSAFSPTDTMPLSSRVKLLMGVQASSALIVSLLVIARAVGGLK